ncbi:MAG: hypothetical protein QM775_30885 [Pirellulales bacterium]
MKKLERRMLYEEFLDGLAAGAYHCDIVNCQLQDGHGNTFNGRGSLDWSSSSGTSLTLMTDGAETLKKSFGKPLSVPGTIIPADVFLKLQGKTMEQWSISIERLAPTGRDFHFNGPEVVWRFDDHAVLSDIEWSRDVGIKGHVVDFLVWPASLAMWPRVSKTTYENPRFSRNVESNDWLECELATGVLAARRFDADKALVRAECKTHEQAEGIVQASATRLQLSDGQANLRAGLARVDWKPHAASASEVSRRTEEQRDCAAVGNGLRADGPHRAVLAKGNYVLLDGTGGGSWQFAICVLGRGRQYLHDADHRHLHGCGELGH